MSDTKEPYKWYWAYESSIDGKHYVFNTFEQARDHAHIAGEFEELSCIESHMAKEESLFFEVREDELPEYIPIQFVNKEVTYGITI